MENLSPIAVPQRILLDIPVRDDLKDHRFGDRPVFPAVEAMEVLAGAVRSRRPAAAVSILADVRFEKFLPVDPHAGSISACCRLSPDSGGGIRAELRSRSRLPSGFSRNLIHAAAVFVQKADAAPARGGRFAPPAGPGFQLPADRLYRELVPFGPAFHTLTGQIALFEGEATASAFCPAPRPVAGSLLGNSFILDAAFHAACAWGQRFAGTVAFPVGIDRRSVLHPTRGGERYAIRAVSTRTGPEALVFDIDIADEAGRLRERAEGVRMRDVSGGRWKPPEWVLKKGER